MGEEDKSSEVVAAEELLAKTLGGWRGLIDSALPTVVFLLFFTVGKQLDRAIIAALVVAAVLAVANVVRRQPLQQIVSGFIGLAVAAWFSSRTGKAEDFFLPGLLTNAAYAIGISISILVRYPIVGVIVGALKGDLLGWRTDERLARLYRMVSWWWVGMFSLRLAVQLPLYFAKQVEILGIVKMAMGWPLYLAVVWVTYRAVVEVK